MRFLTYVVLAVATLFWIGGLSSTVGHWLYDLGLVTDDYRYGDLYRVSALPQFKTPTVACPTANLASDTAKTDLYLIGDSFSEAERIGRSDFPVDHYQRIKWEFPQQAKLNPAHRNVLLIESVERHLRDHFNQPIRELTVVQDTGRTALIPWYKRTYQDLHRKDVEERLESLLFSQDWAFWFKELKARITLNWFDRINTGASLSLDKKQIFLNTDTDSTKRQSSFSRLTDQQVDALVDSINATADRYKRQGFSDVCLAVIPNKVTVLEPNRAIYNHLIERVQQHPRLRVPTVDVYTPYTRANEPIYQPGDTHWTCYGRSLWLNEVRRVLRL